MSLFRLVFVSDTHAPLNPAIIPPGDFLGVAGDLLSEGDRSEWLANLPWLTQAPHAHKAFVPGNHDFYMQERPGPTLQHMRSAGFRVLGLPCNPNHLTMTLPNGLVVGACPFVPGLDNRWAFGESAFAQLAPERYGVPGGEGFQERVQALIEDDVVQLLERCDIIMTHAPIAGHLDREHGKHQGALPFARALDRVHRLKTQLWVHGHTHSAAGHTWLSVDQDHLGLGRVPLLVCNAAISDRQHQHSQGFTIVDWDMDQGRPMLVQSATPR